MAPSSAAHLPLVALGFDAADPFSRAMWLSPASLEGLLQGAPEGTSFLFFSHSGACFGVFACAFVFCFGGPPTWGAVDVLRLFVEEACAAL